MTTGLQIYIAVHVGYGLYTAGRVTGANGSVKPARAVLRIVMSVCLALPMFLLDTLLRMFSTR